MNFNLINRRKFNIKKILLALIFLVFGLLFTFNFENYIDANTSSEIESNLSDNVYDIVDNLDFSGLDNIISNNDNFNIFGDSVINKLEKILNGEYFTNYSSLIGAILSLIFIDIRAILPFVFTIIAIGLLSNMMVSFNTNGKSSSEIISFVFFSVMTIIILIAFRNILDLSSNIFDSIINQMQILFPILITLLTSIGSFSAITIYNPLVAVLTTCVSFVFDKLLYPIFITIFLLTVLSHLTNTIKLDKLISFFHSSFKWIIGIVFTLFTGFLTIQGISAGKFDSVSIKTTKFAMKSYIPIIGSYISDGMDFFVLGGVLVKNAVGLVGVLILFVTILSPILTILIYKLAIQLCGGILELCGNTKMGNFLTACSKILLLPIVLILGIAFMYVITICLIMCTANIF